MLIKVAIRSGNFTDSDNFSGYPASGDRVHIPARQLENLGITKDSKIDFPFYALVKVREFDTIDADGNPTGVKFKRLQAGSIFKTKAEMLEAYNEDALMDLEAKAQLKAQAKAMDLDEDAISTLMSFSTIPG